MFIPNVHQTKWLICRNNLIQSQVLVSMRKIWIDKNASEEIASHQNSTGVINNTCDDNGINLLNT